MATKLRDVIQARMDREGLTYEQLGERVGVSAATLNRLVNNGGKHTPDLATLAKLGLALDVPLYTLVEAVGFDLGLTPGSQDELVRSLLAMEYLPKAEIVQQYQQLPPQLRSAIAAIVDAYSDDMRRRLAE